VIILLVLPRLHFGGYYLAQRKKLADDKIYRKGRGKAASNKISAQILENLLPEVLE